MSDREGKLVYFLSLWMHKAESPACMHHMPMASRTDMQSADWTLMGALTVGGARG